VAIGALFHDLGKATLLFQGKLARALKGGDPEADPVRHELFSAAVWDALFGNLEDTALPAALTALTPDQVDTACKGVRRGLLRAHSRPEDPLKFRFLTRAVTLAHLIGMLILTHHRLPDAESDHLTLTGTAHVRAEASLKDADLAIAPGTPFWHEEWWVAALRMEAARLSPGARPASQDIALRASLMFADHVGSARKTPSPTPPDHLANTMRLTGSDTFVPADSLSRHVKRVTRYARFAHEMTHQLRDRYPALDPDQVPLDIALPAPSADPRFIWQAAATTAARHVCEKSSGGFFGAILAGTGTGKTRGAPTILAAASLADRDPSRRHLRMSLALGLRTLATQSAQEYVEDLGFRAEDVSVLIGDPPLAFQETTGTEDPGSESLLLLPDWLRVERASTGVPETGVERSAGLPPHADRRLPAFLDLVLEAAGRHAGAGRRLISAPIMVGTIDHLMGVAAPTSSRFLLQSLRVLTSDLILDEIDQYDGEDLAAIARLVFQAGAAGRRVLIMSATLTGDVAEALHLAYRTGWEEHARATGAADHVNLLLCGDTPDSVVTNAYGGDLADLLRTCQVAVLAGIRSAPPLRRGEVLPPCESWGELLDQVNAGCSRLHDLNAVEINGVRVSVGLVRMTRISHAAALATQMRSGDLGDRLRVLVCLHSQMPRLDRAFIERRLKRALTRKGADPEAGVRSLCHAEGLFEKADLIGAREIEILVVTTPVIETGNDLDFDWAVLDPISTRSIIQSAGRVRRHRPATGDHPNVLILGRSPVAMQGRALAMPGVETRPAPETGIPVPEGLLGFEGRHLSDLLGEVRLDVISAEPVLREGVRFPLRDAESRLRKMMLSTEPRDPLGRYLGSENARWSLRMTRTRRFRRSENREVLFTLIGDRIGEARWFLDLDPGTRNSALREAGDQLHIAEGPDRFGRLFEDLTGSGWLELTGGLDDLRKNDLFDLFTVSVPSYGDDLGSEMTYTEFTGFTRGSPEDLFSDFGRREKNQ
jgi:CRISPR-associated endonuclease/helicase Cas3